MSLGDYNLIEVERLEDLLFEKIQQEYKERGKCVIGMLETAKGLLTQQEQYSYQTTAIAACIRQAVQVILKGEMYKKKTLGRASDQVIDAAKRYLEAVEQPDTEKEILPDLLDKVYQMKNVRRKSLIYRYRLVAAVKARFGSDTPADIDSISQMYHQLNSDLNRLVHLGLDGQQNHCISAHDCYKKAIYLLASIFLPAARLYDIERLAGMNNPQYDDAVRLKETVLSEYDFDYFASRMRSSGWFGVMDPDMLKSPTGDIPWWLRSCARHLKDEHYDDFMGMINQNFELWTTCNAGLSEIGYVGYILGDRGLSLIIKALRKNKADTSLCHYALLSYKNADPSSPQLVDIADHLMSPDAGIDKYHKTHTVPAKLIKGMNLESSIRIIEILARKLMSPMEWPHIPISESVANVHFDSVHEPNALVVRMRLALVKSIGLGAPTPDLIGALAPMPEYLRSRFVTWLYAYTEDISIPQMSDFVIRACRCRRATGDDQLLLDRLYCDDTLADIATQMTDIIGKAPKLSKMAGEPDKWNLGDEEWRRISWARILHGRVSLSGWDTCLNLINDYMRSEEPDTVDLAAPNEPYAADHRIMAARLGTTSPMADVIHGHHNTPFSPAHLETVAEQDACRWAEKPIDIIRLLYHPAHVANYFHGLARSIGSIRTNSGELIQAVQFVRTHPWPAPITGASLFRYESGWDDADISGMYLIKAIIKDDIPLDDHSIRLAWDIILEAAGQTTERCVDSSSPLDIALSRPVNMALETMILMVRYAQRMGSSVPHDVSEILTGAIHLSGQEGAERRAVIGAHADLLRRILPEWFVQNEQILFGDMAPDNLGQLAFDAHIRWGHPNQHDLEKYREAVIDAVRRGVEGSMDCLIWGMLAGVDGYEPRYIADRLHQMGHNHVLLASERSARLLYGDADQDHIRRGISLWECMLDLSTNPGLAGYGWWAGVRNMDQDLWECMTLRTCEITGGNLVWAEGVAKRIRYAETITDDGLRILRWLIISDPVHYVYHVATHALEALRGTKDAMGMHDSWIILRDTMLDRGYHQASEI